MPVSIRDVAARAGVSRGTVSQALDDNPLVRITPETRERVRRVARELGYYPNHLARSLGRRRTDTLGLMISGLRNPFFVELMEAAERLTMDSGYQALVDAAPSNSDGSYSTHGKLRGWPVDGVLMWAFANQRLGDYLGAQAQDLPVVYLGYARDDDRDWVTFDLCAAARLAVGHLRERGRRKIAYVAPYDFPTIQPNAPRWRGYRDACAEAGQSPHFILMERQAETRAAALHQGLALASLPAGECPDALVCHNDLLAIGVYHGLRRAGLRVPDDIALVGFDGIEEGRYLDIPLTTFVTPAEDLCRAALDILLRRIGGDKALPPHQVTIPTVFRPGGTT